MPTSKEAAFERILAFLRAVRESADAFGPLKSAASMAVLLMETVQV
jgi:hypothetical protein